MQSGAYVCVLGPSGSGKSTPALLYLGYSVNSTEPGELALAELLLSETRDRAAAFTPATTGRDLLVAGELDVSHNHSGDIGAAQEESEVVAYVVPGRGR